MQTRRWMAVTTIMLLALLIAACAGDQGQAAGERAETLDQLLSALEARGFKPETAGALSQPFFAVDAQIFQVNGDDLQVFEFDTQEEAASAATTISLDGSSVGTSMVTWIVPPHFYHSGRLVVLYLGEQSELLSALEEVLGPQLAGR